MPVFVLTQGHDEIDPELCNVGNDLSQLPVKQRMAVNRAMAEEASLPPEERDKRREKKLAQTKLNTKVEEAEAARKASDAALAADPAKKAKVDKLREMFPDIDIQWGDTSKYNGDGGGTQTFSM